MIECDCKDWEEGRSQLINQAVFCHTHSAGPKYDGPIWKHCPWCGKKLKYKEEI